MELVATERRKSVRPSSSSSLYFAILRVNRHRSRRQPSQNEYTMKVNAAYLAILFSAAWCADAFSVGVPAARSSPSMNLRAQAEDAASESSSSSSPPAAAAKPAVPTPPEPFLPALDPSYPVKGAIGEGDFVISRLGGATKEELGKENLLRILMIECSDLEVNTLVWKCLGYRFDPETE